jgi:hypothetical protein
MLPTTILQPDGLFLIAPVIASCFNLLYGMEGSFISSLLVSLLLFFDDVTVNVISKCPYFCCVLILLGVAISSMQKLVGVPCFSVRWIVNAINSVLMILLAGLLRPEVIYFIIPMFYQILVNLMASGRRSISGAVVYCIILEFALYVGLVEFQAWISRRISIDLGLPWYEPSESMYLSFDEANSISLARYATTPWNVAIFGLIPIAIILVPSFSLFLYWPISFVIPTVIVMFSPSHGLDDVAPRDTLALYGMVLTCGFVVCRGEVAMIAIPLLVLVLIGSMSSRIPEER